MAHDLPVFRMARLSSIVHATEDPAKVLRSILNMCPDNFPKKPVSGRVRGHHGNDIQTLELRTQNGAEAEGLFRHIFSTMSTLSRAEIVGNMGRYVDDTGRLYLRLDKQEAFEGNVRLEQADALRVEFAFFRPGKKTSERLANIVKQAIEQ